MVVRRGRLGAKPPPDSASFGAFLAETRKAKILHLPGKLEFDCRRNVTEPTAPAGACKRATARSAALGESQ